MQLYESCNDVFSLLPVKIYKHDLIGPYMNVPLHWHRSIEITINLTGCIRFNTGSSNFDFGESDWIVVNSGEFHSCRYINPTDHFSGISLIISKAFIEKWIGKHTFFYNPQDQDLTAQIKTIASELFALDFMSSNCSLVVMSHLFKILHLIAEKCTKYDVDYIDYPDRDIPVVTAFTDYIEHHYQENITLDSVAEHFKYSASYFSRLFKKLLGVNFHSYLNFVRICHAAQQLASGSLSITDCAFINGFPNTKSFINTFKKIYGCTPGSFLANNRSTP